MSVNIVVDQTTALFTFGEKEQYLTCVKCKCEKPEHRFRIDNKKRSLTKRRSECIDCMKQISIEVNQIRKTAPPVPYACEFCGRTDAKLRLDHCHTTGKFRAWLCNKCNTGFAQLGDTADALERAAQFLREREDSIKNEN